MHRNETCYTLTQDWIIWLDSKRAYLKPQAQNILAQFMPSKAREPRDHELSVELTHFNSAVMSQPNEMLYPFLVVYASKCKISIKRHAESMGIDRRTLYERAHKTADRIMAITRRLEDINKKFNVFSKNT